MKPIADIYKENADHRLQEIADKELEQEYRPRFPGNSRNQPGAASTSVNLLNPSLKEQALYKKVEKTVAASKKSATLLLNLLGLWRSVNSLSILHGKLELEDIRALL